MNISFVIPCLNSELVIKRSVKKLTKKLKKIKNLNYELILIDDGSSDKTNKVINGLKKKKIKIITNSTNLGKSTSLIKGIKTDAKIIYETEDKVILRQMIEFSNVEILEENLEKFKEYVIGNNEYTIFDRYIIIESDITDRHIIDSILGL